MLRILLLTTPILIAAAPPTGQSKETTACHRIGDGLHWANTPSSRAGFRRLDQLPPASEYHTVLHIENGCVTPQIVGYEVGRAERR
jgi:hypothetical protein